MQKMYSGGAAPGREEGGYGGGGVPGGETAPGPKVEEID
jgi:hypothetical protein